MQNIFIGNLELMIDLTSKEGDTLKLSKLEMNQDKGLDEVYCS